VKAVVLHGMNDLRVEDVPEPELVPGSVKIRVEYAGICGSDLHYWRHGGAGTSIVREPIVLGHEITGRIVDVAADVSEIEPGERVTVHPATLPSPCATFGEKRCISRRKSITSEALHAYHTAMGRSVNTSSSALRKYEYFRRTSIPGSHQHPNPSQSRCMRCNESAISGESVWWSTALGRLAASSSSARLLPGLRKSASAT
jgi:hypothetical protein